MRICTQICGFRNGTEWVIRAHLEPEAFWEQGNKARSLCCLVWQGLHFADAVLEYHRTLGSSASGIADSPSECFAQDKPEPAQPARAKRSNLTLCRQVPPGSPLILQHLDFHDSSSPDKLAMNLTFPIDHQFENSLNRVGFKAKYPFAPAS